jgi:hypothetical protein
MSVRDFMNYLLFVEYSAENLQFYLWHRDYVQRFVQAPRSDLALAPQWTRAMEEETVSKLQREAAEDKRRVRTGAAEMFKGTDFDKKRPTETVTEIDPFSPRATTSHSNKESIYALSSLASNTSTLRSPTSEAFASVGAKAPCKHSQAGPPYPRPRTLLTMSTAVTIQPFREEIDRIISTYIMVDAPRQLNLSDRDRRTLLHALSYTTHPSALRIAFEWVDYSLRFQSHPNFIRWSVCNGNPPRVSFARMLGFSGIAMCLGFAIMLTLSTSARGYRAILAIGWAIGICAVVASYRGMCICMYAMHHRHIRPWELFLDAEENPEAVGKRSFDSFGSSNSFEHEPWLVKYSEKNLMLKIFDKEAWIEEPMLRQIQDTIFVQSLLIGTAAAAVLALIFVLIPSGNLFSF